LAVVALLDGGEEEAVAADVEGQEAVQAALSALARPSSHSSPGSWAPSPQKGAVVVVEVEDEVVVAGEDVEAVVSVSVVSVVVVSVVVVSAGWAG
jgi:hypothetical protein